MDASHSILIVEDNVIVAQDIKTRVQKMGYQVTDCVTRGESAIDSVDKNPPNLILMDIKLKGQMSGIEASAIIRSRHDIPIIYLTAYADEETLDHAKLTEPFGYIIKPFDDKDLRSALTISLYKYQMEQKLKESEERFKQLFEYAPLPYQSLDETGTIIEVNHTWLEILGYRRKDVIGKPFVDFLHPDWIRHFKENFSRFKSIGEVIEVEFEMKKKDGTYISTRFDGKIRRNQAGEFIQTHCVFKDVSKEKELQKTIEAQEIALRQNQKLEAIGNLAGGIAHDFNNILSSVIGYTELSLEDVQQGTDLHDNLVEVLNAGERAKTLVKQILTFSRKGEQEKKPIQLNPLVSDAVQMLRSTIPSNIQIKEQISDGPIIITANASQMNQVIMNLVTNAVHAIDDNGIIDIGVEVIHIDKTRAEQYPDIDPGDYAKIFVSDTGCGIARENLIAVFDPYFTTKTPDKGTGLGLAVVHGIVKLHGGHITVYSEPGKGTTFQVYLPLATQPSGAVSVQPTQKIAPGTERILFVDDEPTIVKLQKRTLERLGYAVTAHTGSQAALEAFQATPDLFHLVITDMTMPDMTGDKLSSAIKEIRPDMPVILCTGFSEKVNAKTALNFPIDGFLMKPVDKGKMAETVRKVLDGAKNAGRDKNL